MLFHAFPPLQRGVLSRAFSSAEIITDSAINSTRFVRDSKFFFALCVTALYNIKNITIGGFAMLDLLCPVCGETLVREERVWHCKNRHSFDVARSGYVNLLPPSASGKRHGDDKHMVAARTAFLSRGYYDHLIGAVAEACMQLAGPDACVLDAGCGEGTYTRAIYDALAAKGGRPQLLGADISAEAVKRAARQVPEGIFCVATTARLPLAAESLDLIVNIFSPFMAEEFRRVLKPGGYLLRVVPMEKHLIELKAAVYDHPYENPPFEPAAEGFRLMQTQALRTTITLSSNEDVQALFLMTPYYYKTGAEDQKKLAAVQSLRVTTEFLLAVYQPA